MRSIYYSFIIMAIVLISCHTKNRAGGTSKEDDQKAVSADTFSINDVVSGYLKIKNALVKDDANGAAEASKALFTVLDTINSSSIDAKKNKQYTEIAIDAKEHAEHIGQSASEITQQRAHFTLLSKDINDLIKLMGTNQKLFQDFCPMADEGKGAIWISEIKDIKNPYYGSKMLKCGSIKKTVN